MTSMEAIQYIERVSRTGGKPGLSRTQALLRLMGNPERSLSFVHIAGTNGKGSTAALLERVLRAAGLRTGLFISPHLQRFNERVQVDGRQISDSELVQITEAVVPLAETMAEHPTQFELVTCIALAFFAQRNCEIVVLETGLGGRLDATNAIPPPEVAVITAIGLDHTKELGETAAQIAAEKAGIIKPGSHVVLYQAEPGVAAVVADACERQGAQLKVAAFAALQLHKDTLEGQCFDYASLRNLQISLLGAHQRKNAAVALETLFALRSRGFSIPEEAIRRGFAETVWPGRFEILHRAPVFIADGGHNPQCAAALADNLRYYFPDGQISFLLGVLEDKDYTVELEYLAPLATAFFVVAPCSPRALPAETLGGILRQYGKPVLVCESVSGAVEAALAASTAASVICAFGSLYMTGEIRTVFSLN